MNCPRCGNEIQGKAIFCPHCGQKLEAATQLLDPLDEREEEGVRETAKPPSSSRGCRTSMAMVGVAFLVILLIGGLGIGAVYLGMRDRATVQVQTAREHYDRGEEHLAEGRYELAIAEYERALELYPGYQNASRGLAEAHAQLGAIPVITSTPPIPELEQDTLESYWQQLQTARVQEDWAQVIESAEQLLALESSYRREEIDEILFDAFYLLGLEREEAGRMEEAVRLFDRALALRPNNTRVVHVQNMAKLYMDGVRYSGADWAQAIDRLSTLYSLDPEYKDVKTRLGDAYVAYAEQLVIREDWCLATLQYSRANDLVADATLAALAQHAADQCGEEGLDNGLDPSGPDGPAAPSGTFVGRVQDREGVTGSSIYVRGRILDSNGNGVVGTRIKIQAWDWTAFAISDGTGQFSFDGLSNAVPYTLSLPDLTARPFEVETFEGELVWVLFEEAK